MALGDPYVTLADIKSYARIEDTVDDIEIQSTISAVSRSIEKFCGRQFNDAGSVTARVFSTRNCHSVKVEDFSTSTGLVVATDAGADGAYETTIAASSYTLYPLNGVRDGMTGFPYDRIELNRGAVFPTNTGAPSVQVTARWGWAEVPDDVKQATRIQCARIFGRRYSPHGQPLVGSGDFVFRVSYRMDPDAADLLAPFKTQVLVA